MISSRARQVRMIFELPTQEGVRKACNQFDYDDETKISEPVLTDLLGRIFLITRARPEVPAEGRDAQPSLFDANPYTLTGPSERVRSGKAHSKTEMLIGPLREGSLEIVNTISTTQFPERNQSTALRLPPSTRAGRDKRSTRYGTVKVQNYLTRPRKLHRVDWDKFANGFRMSSNHWGYQSSIS